METPEIPVRFYPTEAGRAPVLDRLRALQSVGLAGWERYHPSQLSGGQQQRVAIARSLINHPQIIMADEPAGALDSRTSVDIMAILQRLNRESNLTIVLITHEPDIAACASRVVSFRDGRIVRDDPVTARRDAVAELLALPAAEEESREVAA